jgi:hypothetical protein
VKPGSRIETPESGNLSGVLFLPSDEAATHTAVITGLVPVIPLFTQSRAF